MNLLLSLSAVAPVYKKGNRVIVKVGRGEYVLATITSVRAGKWNLLFDDGDSGASDDIKDLVGYAVPEKMPETFKRVDLPRYTLGTTTQKPAPATVVPVTPVTIKPAPVTPVTIKPAPVQQLPDKIVARVYKLLDEWLNPSNYTTKAAGRLYNHCAPFEHGIKELLTIVPLWSGPAFSYTTLRIDKRELLRYYTLNRSPTANTDTTNYPQEAVSFLHENKNNLLCSLELKDKGKDRFQTFLTEQLNVRNLRCGGWYKKKVEVTARKNIIKKNGNPLPELPDYRLKTSYMLTGTFTASVEGVRIDSLPLNTTLTDYFKHTGRLAEIIAMPTSEVKQEGLTLSPVIFVLNSERSDFFDIPEAAFQLGF
jgi:hypothetical protein